ncbi:hypothetical protein H0H93_014677, partial [Arthromyces matolae]
IVNYSCSYLPSDTTFTFKCPANQGGIIIPQTQVRREQTPLQDGSLENYVHRHCQNWCHFLKRKTPPKESFGNLFLVTECLRTEAWFALTYWRTDNPFGVSFSVQDDFKICNGEHGIPPWISQADHFFVDFGNSDVKIEPLRHLHSPHPPQVPKTLPIFFKAFHIGERQKYKNSFISLFMQQRNTRLLPAIGGLCSKLLKDVFTTIYTFRNGFTDTPLLLP